MWHSFSTIKSLVLSPLINAKNRLKSYRDDHFLQLLIIRIIAQVNRSRQIAAVVWTAVYGLYVLVSWEDTHSGNFLWYMEKHGMCPYSLDKCFLCIPQSNEHFLYCTVLYCTVLYCTVLYCTVLYCTVLYCTVLYCTVLYCTVLYCTVLYCTVLYCTVLYCTVLYCTVLYCTVLYCTVLYCTVLHCTAMHCNIYCFFWSFIHKWLARKSSQT